jgi:hypothetical protein
MGHVSRSAYTLSSLIYGSRGRFGKNRHQAHIGLTSLAGLPRRPRAKRRDLSTLCPAGRAGRCFIAAHTAGLRNAPCGRFFMEMASYGMSSALKDTAAIIDPCKEATDSLKKGPCRDLFLLIV